MPPKEEIIDNVDQYSAREIVSFIKAGVVTFDELCREAGRYFSATTRREVSSLLAQETKEEEEKEEEDWEKAKSSRSIDELQTYLKNYPKGKHRDEARDLIQEIENDTAPVGRDVDVPGDDEAYNTTSLKDDIENELKNGADERMIFECIQSKCGNRTKAEVLALVQEDSNVIPSGTLRMLCEGNIIKGKDLEDIGINRKYIEYMMRKVQRASFNSEGGKLKEINRLSTEVYFWGIPDSGKSCALGAILSTAYNGSVAHSMSMDNGCKGYGYMVRLSNLFKRGGEVIILPEKTSTQTTYEMGFDLVDNKGLRHPITCIDLAGELMRCMYKEDAGENMTDEDRETLETVTNILIDNRTGNRKIHFFVLEYGAEKREYEGLAQNAYIDAAMTYIEHTGVFKKDTDAIFIMLTKADKVKANGSTKREILREYIIRNYQGFYNRLETLCRDNEINDGEVEIIPFSLGEVCMRYYCLFDDSAAKRVVQLLIDRTKGFKRRGRWVKNLRG